MAAPHPPVCCIQCISLPKTKVSNVRIDDRQHRNYEHAAALAGTTVRTLVTEAAEIDRARRSLPPLMTLRLPSQIFGQVLGALDDPPPNPTPPPTSRKHLPTHAWSNR